MSTQNLCFEQKYENYKNFSENFHFLVVKISVYLNRHVFVMERHSTETLYIHELQSDSSETQT